MEQNKRYEVTILLPAYNEAGVIGETIPYKEFEATRCNHSLFDEVVFEGESLSKRAARTTECSYGRSRETQDIARGR